MCEKIEPNENADNETRETVIPKKSDTHCKDDNTKEKTISKMPVRRQYSEDEKTKKERPKSS